MLVYGLTGGIAWKIYGSQNALSQGFPVVDADVVAKVVAPHTVGLQIVETFGDGILQPNGSRIKKTWRYSFQDVSSKKLESITHPRIFQRIAAKLGEYRKRVIPMHL